MRDFTTDELKKIKDVVDHGVVVKKDVKIMNEGLREVIDDLSKQLDIPKKLINQTIKITFKATEKGSVDDAIEEQQSEIDSVEHLIKAIKK
jgi:hypothetical protein